MSDWIYKIFARRLEDRDVFQIGDGLRASSPPRIETLAAEFGENWQVWAVAFPAEHPHAQLQRRLNSRAIHARAMTASGRRKADGDFLLNDIKIKHAERASINDLLSRPQKREAIQPALLAPPAPPDEI